MVNPLGLIDDISGSETFPSARKKNKVFISYSHEDRQWLDKLLKMLKPLIKSGKLVKWADTDIRAGARWREEIRDALYSAKVAVLLVSPEFLASDFIVENELPPILSAASNDGLKILWIPVSHSLYKETKIADYQAVHNPEQPLDSFSPSTLNKVLVDISKEIDRVGRN
jgi:hypothetical protein